MHLYAVLFRERRQSAFVCCFQIFAKWSWMKALNARQWLDSLALIVGQTWK